MALALVGACLRPRLIDDSGIFFRRFIRWSDSVSPWTLIGAIDLGRGLSTITHTIVCPRSARKSLGAQICLTAFRNDQYREFSNQLIRFGVSLHTQTYLLTLLS